MEFIAIAFAVLFVAKLKRSVNRRKLPLTSVSADTFHGVLICQSNGDFIYRIGAAHYVRLSTAAHVDYMSFCLTHNRYQFHYQDGEDRFIYSHEREVAVLDAHQHAIVSAVDKSSLDMVSFAIKDPVTEEKIKNQKYKKEKEQKHTPNNHPFILENPSFFVTDSATNQLRFRMGAQALKFLFPTGQGASLVGEMVPDVSCPTGLLFTGRVSAGKIKPTRRAVAAFIRSGEDAIWAHVRGPASNPPEYRGSWGLPGGKVDEDHDLSLEAALAREIREEMGQEITQTPIPIFQVVTEDGWCITYFVTQIAGTPTVSEGEKEKIGEWVSMPVDQFKSQTKLTGAPNAVEAYEMMLPNGTTAYVERHLSIPEGFALLNINNKDNLCTLHAINSQLPRSEALDPEVYRQRLPTQGYAPQDFKIKNHKFAVFNASAGKWMSNAADADIFLCYWDTAPHGHYDALIKVGSHVQTYPNGLGRENPDVAKAEEAPTGKSAPIFVRMADLSILDEESWESQELIQIDEREKIFSDIKCERQEAESPNLSTAGVVEYLSSTYTDSRRQAFYHSAESMMSTFSITVDVGNAGEMPTQIFIDHSSANTDPQYIRKENTRQVNDSQDTSKVIKREEIIIPVGGVPGARNAAEDILARLVTQYSEGAEEGYEYLLELLIRGAVMTQLGVMPALANDNNLLGSVGYLAANHPQHNVPGGVPGVASILHTFPDVDTLLLYLNDIRDNERHGSKYFLQAIRKIRMANDIQVQNNVRSAFTVLANFNAAELLAAGNALFSGDVNENRSLVFKNIPLNAKLIFIAQAGSIPIGANYAPIVVPAPANPGYSSAYSVAEYMNPQSWLDAIVWFTSNIGKSAYLGRALERVARCCCQFLPTLQHSLSLPIPQRILNGQQMRDAFMTRIAIMRIERPTEMESRVANAGQAAPDDNAGRIVYNDIIRNFGFNGGGAILEADQVAANAALLPRARIIMNGIAALHGIAPNNANFDDKVFAYNAHQYSGKWEVDSEWYRATLELSFTRDGLAGSDFTTHYFDEYLARLTYPELINMQRWLASSRFHNRWVLGAFPNGSCTIAIALRNGAAGGANVTRERDGYFLVRDGSLSATSLVETRFVTLPFGIEQVKNVMTGAATYGASPEDKRVSQLLATVPPAELVNKILLLAIQIRACADAATVEMGLSSTGIATARGEILTGNVALDQIYARTPLMAKSVMGESNFTLKYLNTIEGVQKILKFPLSISSDIREYHNTIQLQTPQMFGLSGEGESYMNANVLWTAFHYVHYPALLPVKHMVGSPLAQKLELFAKAVPGTSVPFTSWAINTDVSTPAEVIAGMRVIAALDAKCYEVTTIMTIRTSHTDGKFNFIRNNIHYVDTAPRISDCVPCSLHHAMDYYHLFSSPYSWAFAQGHGNSNVGTNDRFGHIVRPVEYTSFVPNTALPSAHPQIDKISALSGGQPKTHYPVVRQAYGATNDRRLPLEERIRQYQLIGNDPYFNRTTESGGAPNPLAQLSRSYLSFLMGGQSAGYQITPNSLPIYALGTFINYLPAGGGPGPVPLVQPGSRSRGALLLSDFERYGGGNTWQTSASYYWLDTVQRMMAKIARCSLPLHYRSPVLWAGKSKKLGITDVNVNTLRPPIPTQTLGGMAGILQNAPTSVGADKPPSQPPFSSVTDKKFPDEPTKIIPSSYLPGQQAVSAEQLEQCIAENASLKATIALMLKRLNDAEMQIKSRLESPVEKALPAANDAKEESKPIPVKVELTETPTPTPEKPKMRRDKLLEYGIPPSMAAGSPQKYFSSPMKPLFDAVSV